MNNLNTIQLNKSILNTLDKLKEYPSQSYNELFSKIIKEKLNTRNHYEKFLYEIQQKKMNELWDNDYDKEWENV